MQSATSIIREIEKIDKKISTLKNAYAVREDLLKNLAKLKYKECSKYKLVDRFKTAQKVFTTTSVSRFNLLKK